MTSLDVNPAEFAAGLRQDAEASALTGAHWVAGRLLNAALIIEAMLKRAQPEEKAGG